MSCLVCGRRGLVLWFFSMFEGEIMNSRGEMKGRLEPLILDTFGDSITVC